MDLSTEKQGLCFDNNNILDWLSKRQNTIAFLWRKTSSASHSCGSCALSGWMFQQRARNLADKHLPQCFSSCLAAITNHVWWVQWLSKLDAGRHGPSICLPATCFILWGRYAPSWWFLVDTYIESNFHCFWVSPQRTNIRNLSIPDFCWILYKWRVHLLCKL